MEPTDELWTLEWSQRQGFFHVEPLRTAVKKNLESFARDRRTDYIPLHIGTQEECDAVAARLRPALLARDATLATMP
ncbi:hypothetical protein CAL26_23775 [Bordetella genomosp. 9]|uniref:Uncharacterized protein n=1 Tax=Bordetella genomosp. 9 TaxID=1416803 RepID=A0A261R6V6_9BORD|nr:hypothetical protein [Bordetella genomosp. 9]OZI20517.1 hypothetical protein CAL26_23775 [Bordetella genomosp. 9]